MKRHFDTIASPAHYRYNTATDSVPSSVITRAESLLTAAKQRVHKLLTNADADVVDDSIS